MNKKILLVLIAILYLTGCNKKNQIYYDLKKVDNYLYEITYDDYEYDTNLETITNIEDFACSSVKNGNYYGRNFDFIFNDIPEFVTRVNKTNERHASIGIAYLSDFHEKNGELDVDYERLKLLPNFTLDGINDAGVICSDNVVPKEDTAPITGTNPNGEKLHIGFIVRYVLDNASSADEAIDLLKKRNIYGEIGEHYNLHFMIADKDKTYIVEFIDNKMVTQEKMNDDQIMTNYYVNLDYLTENSAGIERYNILKQNYQEGSTFNGMWTLMQKVKYSNAYLFDEENEWYSEFLPQSSLKNLEDFQNQKEEFIKLKQNYWISKAKDQRVPANLSYWHTTHNSIYDIKERKLRITVQENYNKYYEYTL